MSFIKLFLENLNSKKQQKWGKNNFTETIWKYIEDTVDSKMQKNYNKTYKKFNMFSIFLSYNITAYYYYKLNVLLDLTITKKLAQSNSNSKSF